MTIRARLLMFAFAAISASVAPPPAALGAQSIDLMYRNTGISFGDSRRVNGLRFNYRDDRMEFVRGVNATIGMPYDGRWDGTVHGIALGVPMAGARDIRGFAVAIGGAGARRDFNGIGVALGGIGAGRDVNGIMIAGLGAGAGGNLSGFTFGLVGAGAGNSIKGITIGGVGAGAGGDVTGLTIGGIGAGAGRDMNGITIGGIGAGAGASMTGLSAALIGAGAGLDARGITIGGIGAGAGHDMNGIAFGGVGAGAGHDMTGLAMSVVAAGAGGTLRGVGIAGAAVGAPRVRGLTFALASGGHDFVGGSIAPLYFRGVATRDEDAYVKGITVSAWNRINGEQRGLSIGLLNTAWELRGWQIGLLNYAENNPRGLRLLPLFNRRWR